jgi:hypothetical protein
MNINHTCNEETGYRQPSMPKHGRAKTNEMHHRQGKQSLKLFAEKQEKATAIARAAKDIYISEMWIETER